MIGQAISRLVSASLCALALNLFASGGIPAEFDPVCDLAPGMEFSCRVRFAELKPSGANVVSRDGGFPGGYFLRLDPALEGSRLSFFANLGGKLEPRASSQTPVGAGKWHSVRAGWDGTNLFIEVDGRIGRVRRQGLGVPRNAKMKIGGPGVEVKELKFSGAGDDRLVDSPMQRGFRMGCSVVFDSEPFGMNELAYSKGAYLLRYDRPGRGKGAFRFWPVLDGKLEPSVGVEIEAEPKKRYRIAVCWDGIYEWIWVDGKLAKRARKGTAGPLAAPLRTGAFAGRLEELVVRPAVSPNPFFAAMRTVELMPRYGEKLRISARLCNSGAALESCRVLALADGGVKIEPAEIEIAALGEGERKDLEWKVDPGENKAFGVRLQLCSGKVRLAEGKGWFSAMPREASERLSGAWQPPVKPSKTYYVDAAGGDDAASGLAEAEAWKSFANVQGLVLGPGERLLLKRGSVFNEELRLTAAGEPGNWAEIGAYGNGPRPHIRRNRDIGERAAYILSPRCLAVRDLVVSNAGKGLVVDMADAASGNVLVERCLAHHIEGLYRKNSHGIPEWFGRDGAPGGARGGIAIAGENARDTVMRDCEMYQCSNGFSAQGRDVAFTRIFCHDNFCHNTSPHPVFTSTTRAWLTDSIFDSAGWNATWGTMGIMFANNRALEVKGCFFVNMRDSGSGDGGGIDFECLGDNALVEECTFRNNAGAAIEFLGFSTPQAHNTHIRRCRFDSNNFSLKLGPSEIYVHGSNDNDLRVVDANGLVERNGYVLKPGVSFFTNVSSVTSRDWKLSGNVRYGSWRELDAAMPLNNPPEISFGGEIWTDRGFAELKANVADDGRTGRLECAWEQLEGPAIARIETTGPYSAAVSLPRPGDYVFMAKADDGQYWRSARVAVHRTGSGVKVAKAWTFERNLDAEGWTFSGLGTKREKFFDGNSGKYAYADPVNLVCGDYFVLAMKDAASARIVSPDNLGLPAAKARRLVVKMHNATDSSQIRLAYTTVDSPGWSEDKVAIMEIRPRDRDDAVYELELPFAGVLKRFRLEFGDKGKRATGTCRIDYVRLSN
jgi:hypothetical protein